MKLRLLHIIIKILNITYHFFYKNYMFKLILKKKKTLKIMSFLLTYIERTGRKRRKMGCKKRSIGRSAA